MITWDKVIQQALYLYWQRDNITYCLGCSGQVVGRDKLVENQFKYYYDHGWKEKIGKDLKGWNPNMSSKQAFDLWANINRNKMAFDCSGYIDFCLGYGGKHTYSSGDFGKMPEYPSVAQGSAGAILWKSGHVGLDIGYGYELEIGSYNHTIHLEHIGVSGWTKSIKCKDIDYSGADSR